MSQDDFRSEPPELLAVRREVLPVAADMDVDRGRAARRFAAMKRGDLVPARDQPAHGRAADEPGPAEDQNPHGFRLDAGAAPLEQRDVAPDAAELPELLAHADRAESAAMMDRNRRQVFRKDAGLESPDPGLLRDADELGEQGPSDTRPRAAPAT